MAKSNNLKDFLTDVADAIREVEGSSGLINPQTFSGRIRAISGGGGAVAVQASDVNFRDYDGTILHSYTKAEFLALSALPPLPTQKGLICQEWNFTLADAQEYVSEYGVLEVGATYITDDGKTRLYITIASEGRMNVPLELQQSVSNGVVVDWGDGSATETFTGTSATTLRHTYGKVGDYVITLEVTSGTLTLSGSSSYGIFADSMRAYSNMLQKVEIGNGLTSIGTYAFNYCHSLTSVVLPKSVTSIGNNAFNNCYSLASVVLPKSVTSISNSTFYYCYSLASVVFPNSVASIGEYVFKYCYSLASVVLPKSVTSIGTQSFYACSSVAFYDFRTHTSVPALSNTNAFSSIPSDCKIVVPDALYDTWKSASNWSTYASYVVKASEFIY